MIILGTGSSQFGNSLSANSFRFCPLLILRLRGPAQMKWFSEYTHC